MWVTLIRSSNLFCTVSESVPLVHLMGPKLNHDYVCSGRTILGLRFSNCCYALYFHVRRSCMMLLLFFLSVLPRSLNQSKMDQLQSSPPLLFRGIHGASLSISSLHPPPS